MFNVAGRLWLLILRNRNYHANVSEVYFFPVIFFLLANSLSCLWCGSKDPLVLSLIHPGGQMFSTHTGIFTPIQLFGLHSSLPPVYLWHIATFQCIFCLTEKSQVPCVVCTPVNSGLSLRKTNVGDVRDAPFWRENVFRKHSTQASVAGLRVDRRGMRASVCNKTSRCNIHTSAAGRPCWEREGKGQLCS